MKACRYLLALCTLLLVLPVAAEQKVERGDWEIHYNAFNSTFVEPEVAARYSLVRSKTRGLLNVAVLRRADGSARSALIRGTVSNLVGQRQQLRFREIREGEALYYLAGFRFTDDEVLRFELEVQPDPNGPAWPVRFEQRFFVDQ